MKNKIRKKKEKYNPYTILKIEEKYIISFKDSRGKLVEAEVSKEVYDLFDRSELLDISQMHEFERHIEHFDLDEYSLFNKAVNKGISLEDKIERNILIDDLKCIITNLPKIQKSRLIKYFFENKTYEQIAKEEHCTKRAVKFSVDLAIKTGSFAKGETRANLFSILATTIKLFSDTGIANLTSRTDFELDDIGKKKTAVFLIIPDEKESRHEPASLFIDQCYQALINTAQSLKYGKMPYRVNFILDEFANMPTISSISNKITVSRVLQDFAQLKEKYKEQTGTIKSNCNNWIYLLTSDNETAKKVSTRLGKYMISSSRVSTSGRLDQNDFNISNDKSLMGRELMMPDELMRFKFGEALFMKTRLHPIKTKVYSIGNYPIKVKVSKVPIKKKEHEIKCFDLDKLRKERTMRKPDYIELE